MIFLEQFEKLRFSKPRSAMFNLVNENSPYGNFNDSCKNCYLLSNAYHNEDSYFGRDIFYCKNVVDSDHCHYCELCYECLDCQKCYNGNFLQDCEDCTDCQYGYDLKGCHHCFGCAGLRRASYHLFNEPVSKDEYKKHVADFRTRESALEAFETVKRNVPRLFAHQIHNENVTGDYIYNSQNVLHSFDAKDSRDLLYAYEVLKMEDSMDISFNEFGRGNYECMSAFYLSNSQFCTICWESSDLEYCELVFRSEYCFGCVYLNHKKFHILNQPYSQAEYFRKVAEIKAEMKAQGIYGTMLSSSYFSQESCAMMERM